MRGMGSTQNESKVRMAPLSDISNNSGHHRIAPAPCGDTTTKRIMMTARIIRCGISIGPTLVNTEEGIGQSRGVNMASTTDHFSRSRSVRTVAIAVAVFSIGVAGAAPPAQGFEAPTASAEPKPLNRRSYQDYAWAPYKSPAEGVELIYKGIAEEMRNPTKEDDGDIHWVEHQWILKDLAFEMGKRAKEGKEGELKLRQLLAAETGKEVKDLLVIALGYFGDKTVWRDLVRIMKQKGQPVIRESAAQALSPFELNAVLAIPDLIDALKDREFVIRGVPQIEPHLSTKQPVFPVCYMAFGVLQWFKVIDPFSEKNPLDYEVDRTNAVNVLKPELQNKDKEHVKEAIEAIARVGGPEAKAELKRFIQEQQCLPGATGVVEKAKEALSRMEAAEKLAGHEVKSAERYEPGKSSLVEFLAVTLACKNQNEAMSAALDAIAQCDGKLARRELERFITETSGKPGRSDLVTKARELLLRIKP